MSDIVPFNLDIYRTLGNTAFSCNFFEENKVVIGMSATSRYSKGDEFNYAYSSDLRPIQLLYSYGMYFPNNPYAVTFAR